MYDILLKFFIFECKFLLNTNIKIPIMKKIYSLFFMIAAVILFFGSSTTKTYAQVDELWERSYAKSSLPSWFGTDTERGLAYSPNNDRLIVASRAGGNNIYVLNAATGENIQVEDPGNPGTFINKKLDITGIAGGTYVINDVETDGESAIFVCNLTVGLSTSAFKVYMWSNEDAVPVNIISQTDASLVSYRVGDRFTVEGKLSDNTIKIYAVAKHASSPSKVLVWTTTDNGASWNYSILCDGLSATSNQPTVATISGSTDLMFNGNVITPTRMSVTGTNLGAVPAAIVETNSNAMVTYVKDNKTSLITFIFKQSTDLPTNYGRVIIADITDIENSVYLNTSTNLGTVRNLNGAGDVELKDNGNGTYTLYTLATNNGIGAYIIKPAMNIVKASTFNPTFLTTYGNPSESQSYQFNAYWFSNDVTITAPAGFEVSLDDVNFSQSITLTPTENMIPSTQIYVRLIGDAINTYSGDITHTATDISSRIVSISGTVSKADQTITFDAPDAKTFGDAAFDLNATASSGLDITYESSNTSVATISGSTVTIVGAGSTTITASQAGNDNYNAATSVEQTLTVNKADQTITFDALPAKTTSSPAFELTATASSGLTVTYSSSNTSVATISENTVTITGPGTTDIKAMQAGNDNYNAATDVTQTLTVTTPTGIEEMLAKEIRLYPVPAGSSVTIDLGTIKSSNASIKILDLSGKTVLEIKMKNTVEEIELKGISAGVYFMNILLDNQLITKKFSKK